MIQPSYTLFVVGLQAKIVVTPETCQLYINQMVAPTKTIQQAITMAEMLGSQSNGATPETWQREVTAEVLKSLGYNDDQLLIGSE